VVCSHCKTSENTCHSLTSRAPISCLAVRIAACRQLGPKRCWLDLADMPHSGFGVPSHQRIITSGFTDAENSILRYSLERNDLMTAATIIAFPGVSDAEANMLAGSLNPAIRETDPNVSVERRRTNAESQDAGIILGIILGSAAVSTVARGIAVWLARHSGTTIEIQLPDGTSVRVKYASGQDTAETVAAALAGKGR
jgi:hypothetical protein